MAKDMVKIPRIRLVAIVVSVVFVLSSFFALAYGAGPSSINSSDCSEWMVANPSQDALEDQRTGNGSVSQDIVGDSSYPSAFLYFDEGDMIAVRIRVNNCDGSPASPEYKHFAYIGIDINGDGAIEFFLGINNPAGGSGRLGIYLADPSLANTGPGNTGLTKPIASFQPEQGVNFSVLEADDSFFSNDPDYYVSFLFTLADINKALSSTGYQLTDETPFTYIIGTGTGDNSITNDVNGLNGLGSLVWPSSGPISTDGADYFVVTYEKTLGDREAAPRMMTCKENKSTHSSVVDSFPNPPKKRVTSDGKSWTFEGWSTTDPYDSATLGIVTPFAVGTTISGDLTLYAVWEDHDAEQLSDDMTVHFNPSGGGWTAAQVSNGSVTNVNYHHDDSEDGILPTVPIPPTPSPPTGYIAAASGQSVIQFGGWVTTSKVYINNGQRAGWPNIIDLSSGNVMVPGMEFFVWSQLVADLNTPNNPGIDPQTGLPNPPPAFAPSPPAPVQAPGHADEPTVYALWIIANNSIARITFYDNIYEAGTPEATTFGTLLYTVYARSNGNTIAYGPSLPTRQGFSFAGWNTQANGLGTWYDAQFGQGPNVINGMALNANMTLYAIWIPANYALQFLPNTIDLDGAGLTGSPTGTFGAIQCYDESGYIRYPAFPAPPTLSGYTFAGFNTDPDGYGYWINWDDIASDWYGDIIYPHGDLKFSLLDYHPPIDLIPGVPLVGYNRLYAQWQRDPVTSFNVTFDAMGGEFYDSSSSPVLSFAASDGKIDGNAYIAAAPPKWPADPSTGKEVKVFEGWSYSNDPSRTVDFMHPAAISQVFLGPTDIYAVWRDVVDASVTFWPNGGEWPGALVAPITLATDDYGLVPYVPFSNVPVFPIRVGFDFIGWNTAIDGSGDRFNPGAVVTADTHVYAQWKSQTPDHVVVTFFLNDGTGDVYSTLNDSSLQGSTLVKPANPVGKDTGWHFDGLQGWFKDPECLAAWDFGNDTALDDPTVLYGKWYLDVELDLGGAPAGPQYTQVQFRHTLSEPSEPIWDDYEFLGWFADSARTIPYDFDTDPVLEPFTLYAK